MNNSKDIIIKLRLLIKPPININNFFYKVTYTTFSYQNKDGSHVTGKVVDNTFVKFTPNPSANKNGMLAIDSEEILLLAYNNNINKISTPASKNSSAWFQIENRSNGKVAKKYEYPEWSYRHERKVSTHPWNTTSSKNSTTPNTKKTQQIKQKCPHTIDGAIEVAKYIVDEIKKNVKSDTANTIRGQNRAHRESLKKKPSLGEIFSKSNPYSAARVSLFPHLNAAKTTWTEHVLPERPWDHKPLIANDPVLKKLTVTRPIRATDPSAPISKSHFHKYKNYDYFYDVWSNIHYGYVGLSVGFDENILMDGSNMQQSLNPMTSGADTEDDKTAMQIGIQLYKKFGMYAENLKYQHILDSLNATPRNESFNYSKQIHWCFNKSNPASIKKI